MTANEKLMDGLTDALDEQGQATPDATPMVAQVDQSAVLAELLAKVEALAKHAADLEAENAQVKTQNATLKTQVQTKARVTSNAHLATKSIDEMIGAIKGHPVQVILRTVDPETGAAIDIPVNTAQHVLGEYGNKDASKRPGMSLQSSTVVMKLPGLGETTMFLQGKLIIEKLGR